MEEGAYAEGDEYYEEEYAEEGTDGEVQGTDVGKSSSKLKEGRCPTAVAGGSKARESGRRVPGRRV